MIYFTQWSSNDDDDKTIREIFGQNIPRTQLSDILIDTPFEIDIVDLLEIKMVFVLRIEYENIPFSKEFHLFWLKFVEM